MKLKSLLKAIACTGAFAACAAPAIVVAGDYELASKSNGVSIKQVVASGLKDASQLPSGFKWDSKQREYATASNPKAERRATFKWESTSESAAYAGRTSKGVAPEHVTTLNGFRWGVRNTVSADGFRWGVRSVVEQDGFRWGVRNSARQQGFRWGVRSAFEQDGFRWGVRSASTNQGFRWGVRSSADQQGFRWGVRNSPELQGFRWGVR